MSEDADMYCRYIHTGVLCVLGQLYLARPFYSILVSQDATPFLSYDCVVSSRDDEWQRERSKLNVLWQAFLAAWQGPFTQKRQAKWRTWPSCERLKRSMPPCVALLSNHVRRAHLPGIQARELGHLRNPELAPTVHDLGQR